MTVFSMTMLGGKLPFIRTMILIYSDSAFDPDDRESVVVLSASLLLMFLSL